MSQPYDARQHMQTAAVAYAHADLELLRAARAAALAALQYERAAESLYIEFGTTSALLAMTDAAEQANDACALVGILAEQVDTAVIAAEAASVAVH